MQDRPSTPPTASTDTPASGYMAEAEQQDTFLRQADRDQVAAGSGTITEREAADARVEAIRHHLEATVALRVEHFGGTP